MLRLRKVCGQLSVAMLGDRIQSCANLCGIAQGFAVNVP